MRNIIAIIDKDLGYAKRLADYINQSAKIPFKSIAYSSYKAYKDASKIYDTEVILISQEEYELQTKPDDKIPFIVLSEEGYIKSDRLIAGKSIHAVLKYVSADDIIKDILNVYKPQKEDAWFKIAKKQSKMIGIYSPINRCAKTQSSIALATVASEYKRTLLISFEDYKGILYETLDNQDYDLSDVLYAYKQGNCSWEKLSKIVYSRGAFNMITPARYADDIAELSARELAELIQLIVKDSDYELIVIDFGILGKRAVEILDMCHSIYMPILADPISEKKIEEFYEYLGMIEQEGIRDRILSLSLPQSSYMGMEPERLAYTELGDYMRNMFQAQLREA